MKVSRVFHQSHAFGYCDLYSIEEEPMGDTPFTKGYDSFVDGDPIHPRRIAPAELQGDARVDWYKGWGQAQEAWKILMRFRGGGKRCLAAE
jgi:hypothetical protein